MPRSESAPYRSIVAVFAAVVILSGPSRANDGFGALAAGGIAIGHTDKIAMAHETLEVGYRSIDVEYEFVNESDSDVTETVSFPLPPYSATPAESGIVYSGAPLDFRVAVNGKPVEFDTRVWAYLNGKDATDRLEALGFTQKQIALVPFEKSVTATHELSRPPENIAALRAAGFLDNDNSPLWQIRVAYEWRQTFPAHMPIRISHSYRPLISEGTVSGYAGLHDEHNGDAWLRKEFCADGATLKRMHRLYASKNSLDVYGEVPGAGVKYILMTGNTWKDGIRDFTLRIHKASPNEIVSLCFDGTFRRIGGLILETQLKNFHPRSDLDIYFGNAWGAGMPNPNNPPTFDGEKKEK